MPPDDPLSDLLTLEDTLYTHALSQGISDGARAGRIEGRIFGLEKGFEKFAALGALHGRGAVWGSRLTSPASASHPSSRTSRSSQPSQDSASEPKVSKCLPPLNASQRLTSNTTLLYHLTDPPTFSTSNTEATVADYEDRVKRAGAKVKVIERMVGESSVTSSTSTTTVSSSTAEDATAGNAEQKRIRLLQGKKGNKSGDSMEDFAGSRLIG